MATFRRLRFELPLADVDGRWELDGPKGQLFMGPVHVLDAHRISKLETIVFVADAGNVDPEAVAVSGDDVDRIFFRLGQRLTVLASPSSDGFYRDGLLAEYLQEAYWDLFVPGHFVRMPNWGGIGGLETSGGRRSVWDSPYRNGNPRRR